MRIKGTVSQELTVREDTQIFLIHTKGKRA
jgi:hypothetical protein